MMNPKVCVTACENDVYFLVTQHARGLHLNENKILHCPVTSMMHTHSNYCSNQAADNQTQLIIL